MSLVIREIQVKIKMSYDHTLVKTVCIKNIMSWAVVAHAFNPSTREAEASGSL